MSMLPELFEVDELDTEYEDRFFSVLQFTRETEDIEESLPPIPKRSSARSTFTVTGRVVTSSYSYPRRFDPLIRWEDYEDVFETTPTSSEWFS